MVYVVVSGVAVQVHAEQVDDLLRKIDKAFGPHPVVLSLQNGEGHIVVNNESSYVVLDVLPTGMSSAGIVEHAVLERVNPDYFDVLRSVDTNRLVWLVVNGLAIEVDPEDVDELLGELDQRFGRRPVYHFFGPDRDDYTVIATESAYALLYRPPTGCAIAHL